MSWSLTERVRFEIPQSLRSDSRSDFKICFALPTSSVIKYLLSATLPTASQETPLCCFARILPLLLLRADTEI
jgi:hypothetical protein